MYVCTLYVCMYHELPRGINDRLMTPRLHLHGNRHATIISAYAPTLVSDDEEKQRFYDNLRDVLQAVPKGDKIVLTGDFNARVGKDWQTWDSLGRHGVGSMNGNGQLLLQLCTEFNLFISSTQFCHKRGSYNNVDAPQISTVASS